MTLENLKQILELGWPGIVTAMLFILAKSYIDDQRKQIATLWDRVTVLEADLIKVKQQLIASHLADDIKPKRREE